MTELQSLRDRIETLEAEKAEAILVIKDAKTVLEETYNSGYRKDSAVSFIFYRLEAFLSQTTPSLLLDVVRAVEKLDADGNFYARAEWCELRDAIRAYRAAMNGEKQ